ncbi:MAG: alpha/beta fold hydrolase [Betaproteobacteria bacterium]
MSFVESFVQIDGCKTRLLRGGQGAPLLYLHGANGVTGIQPFMLTLAERFDVWIPEHPGFGQSDEPDWLENIHDLAYYYLNFMRHHQLSGAHVLGSSIGGWLALEIAVRDTSRIKTLSLIGPSGIRTPGVVPGDVFLWSPEQLIRNTFHDQTLADRMLASPPSPEQQEVLLKNRFTFARLAWEPRLHDPKLHKWISRIDVPTQIIWGEQDKILPVGAAQAFREAMPQASIAVVPDCGHLPQSERPDQFCDVLFKFLSGK